MFHATPCSANSDTSEWLRWEIHSASRRPGDVLAGEQPRTGLAAGDQGDRQQGDGGDGPQWRSVAVRIRRWNQGGHYGAGHQPTVEQEAEEERRRRALLTVRRAEDDQRENAGADQRETDQGAADPELQPAGVAAHSKDDRRPATRHDGWPQTEGDD